MPALPVLLFITFLVLKLTEVIDWPWIWVTSPLWISVIVAVVLWTGFILLAAWLGGR